MPNERLSTDLSAPPYFDDYDPLKDYHRILYRPGRAVQARELNQAQTVLQEQVARHGDHVFQEGTVVSGVNPRHENPHFVRLKDSDNSGRSVDVTSFVGLTFRGESSGITARVHHSIPGSEADGENTNTIYVDYISSGTDGTTKTFQAGEAIVSNGPGDSVLGSAIVIAGTNTVPATGYGSRVSVGDGIIYAKGHFLRVESQFIILDKYAEGSYPGYHVLFDVEETIVTSVSDESLLDNALGQPNHTAPGADRLRFTPKLRKRVISDAPEDDAVFLLEVIGGEVRRQHEETVYDGVGRELAERTFEESGNYVISPMILTVKEHLRTDDNGGRWEGSYGNADRLAVGISSGVAYVEGYRIETLSTVWLDVDKGVNDYESTTNDATVAGYGNWVEVDAIAGLWESRTYQTVDLRNAAATAPSNGYSSATAPGTSIGSARVRNFRRLENGNYALHLFDVEMSGTAEFADVRGVYSSAGEINSHADVVLDNSRAVLRDSGRKIALYRSHVDALRTVSGVDTIFRHSITVTVNADGENAVTVSNLSLEGQTTDYEFHDPGSFTEKRETRVVVIDQLVDSAGVTYPPGFVFDMTTSPRDVSVTNSELSIKLLGTGVTFTTVGRIMIQMNVVRKDVPHVTKSLLTGRYVKVDVDSHTAGTAGPWNLGIPDVVNLEAVYVDPSGGYAETESLNRIQDFVLDGGQRDEFYETGIVRLRPGATAITAGSTILFKFSYFSHGSGHGYFSVDSYVGTHAGAIELQNIPRYDADDGILYDLREALDFRPTVSASITHTLTSAISTAPTNPAAGTTLNIPSTGSYTLWPGSRINFDASYYLPRTDRIVVSRDGTFEVVKGIPAHTPHPPIEPSNRMTVGVIRVAPFPSLSPEYAADLDRPEQSCSVVPQQQKRYRMEDITKLEKRLDRLEYYSSLNMLEQDTRNLTIEDSNGLDRFKNGIFVDRFFDHSLGAVSDTAYSIAIDRAKGECRPSFEQHSVDMTRVSGGSVNSKYAVIDLDDDYSHILESGSVYQGTQANPVASGNVVFVIASGDSGSGNTRLYLENVQGTFNTTANLRYDGSTQIAGVSAVEQSVNGPLITLPYSHEVFTQNPFATKERNAVGEILFDWVGRLELDPDSDHWADTVQLPEVQQEVILTSPTAPRGSAWTEWESWNTVSARSTSSDREFTTSSRSPSATVLTTHRETVTVTTSEDTRRGTRFSVEPFAVSHGTGPFVRSVDIVPFMRGRRIQFSAFDMRPNTRVYPYFDGIIVSDHCAPAGGNFGDSIITDSDGRVTGTFRIPNQAGGLRFRAGERDFRLIDVDNLETSSEVITTSANATYDARGLSVVTQGITTTTRGSRTVGRAIEDTRVRTDASTFTRPVATRTVPRPTPRPAPTVVPRPTRSPFWSLQAINANRQFGPSGDPIAQTFYVNVNSSEASDITDGVFVTGIDVYFSKKSDTLGVTVELREVANGVITTNSPAFGRVSLLANQVNASRDGYAPTPFKFPAPVFLRGDREYAFVVRPQGNSPDYSLWTSELGGVDIATGSRVVNQPAEGIMFTSANDRTYTPHQSEDLKFTIYRARFTSLSETIDFENVADDYAVVPANSNFPVGERVWDTADDTTNGVIAYSNPERGHITISESTGGFAANDTLRTETRSTPIAITSLRALPYEVISPKVSQVVYPGSSVSWSIKGSVSDGAGGYEAETDYVSIENSVDNPFRDTERFVVSRSNDGGTRTLLARAAFTSNNDRISPVVDIGKSAAMILIHSFIGSSEDNETSNNGSALARYISKKVTLKDGQDAEDLRVYITAYKPAGTDIGVYARFQSSEDSLPFRDQRYTKLNLLEDDAFSSVNDPEDFVELSFGIPTSNDGSGGAYLDTTGVIVYSNSATTPVVSQAFKFFSVKLVFTSTLGAHIVPRVRDLRVVALQA